MARGRRACAEHGFVDGDRCPICNEATYDLGRPQDYEFLQAVVRQRRNARTTRAGLWGLGLGVVVNAAATFFSDGLIPINYVTLIPLVLVLALVAELVYAGREHPPMRDLERELTPLTAVRRATRVPVLVGAAAVIVFAATVDVQTELLGGDRTLVFDERFIRWALVPSRLLHGLDVHTLVTAALLHANVAHLLGNVFGLAAFGLAVDLRLGRLRTAAVFLAAVVVGGLTHCLLTASPDVPTIGMSGGIFGLAGAYLVLMPRRTWHLAAFGTVLPIPAWILVPLLLAGFATIDTLTHAHVAHWAHIGGFVVGAGAGIFARRSVAPPPEFVEAEAQRMLAANPDT